jgi:hypothetical protein
MHADDTPTLAQRLAAYAAVLEAAPGYDADVHGQ